MAIAQNDVTAGAETFDSVSPATGEVVATFPVHDRAAVDEVVSRARIASTWWQGLGDAGRRTRLLAFKGLIAQRAEELCDLVHRENGKPRADAYIEAILTTDHLDWATKKAPKVLGPHRVPSGLTMLNQASTVEYQPLGVIGVIGPWNYPVFTPMGSIGYALAAGNAVVFKPSEYTPAVGQWLADTFAEVVPEQPVFQVVTGFGDTGHALCTAAIDKLAFTGSAKTGRKVMAACAENLTPVLMECGGKDPMIVDDDADVDAAATAAVWGGLQNAGQACISVERVYATDAVYDRFVDKVTELAREVRCGEEADADIGPITMPSQIDLISTHLKDAFDRGARAVVGGPESVHPPFVDPVVLVDVPPDALMLRDETFGPTLPIVRVRDADEALERANETDYGLASSVFAKERGMELARKLRAGMTSVNSVTSFAGVPALPFGGSGESGFGRVHGEDGLKEFTRAKAITRMRFKLPTELMSFRRPTWLIDQVGKLTRLRHSGLAGRSRG
jgi:acyl-CoA reductase-like NAD-dependent aldehyde dehydrogenase